MDVLGIETGPRVWSVVHMKTSAFKVEVKRFLSFAGESFEERIAALQAYVTQKGLKNARIAIGLPRESSLSMVLRIPAPRPDAIEGILAFELEKHVPSDPADLCHGFQVLKKDRSVYSILLAAAKKDLVEAMVERFTLAGLAPTAVTTWHVSLFNALYYSNNIGPEKNVAFININDNALTLDVFSDLMPVYSKSVMLHEGNEDPEQRLDVIERELKRSILAMTGPIERRRLDEGILISDEDPGEEFLRHISDEMAMPVKTQGLKGLGLPGTAATALGSALSVFGKGRVSINLASDSATVKKGLPFMNTMALVIILAVLAFSTGASYIVKDFLTMRGLESTMSGLKVKKDAVKTLSERENSLFRKINTLEELDGRRSPGPLKVLKELALLLPPDTWLTGIDYSGGSVTIDGYSSRASRLLIQMDKSEYMKDFEFAGPVSKTPNGKERFRMNFKLKANAGAGGKAGGVR